MSRPRGNRAVLRARVSPRTVHGTNEDRQSAFRALAELLIERISPLSEEDVGRKERTS